MSRLQYVQTGKVVRNSQYCWIVICLAFFSVYSVNTSAIEITIGKDTIQIPSPQGFVNLQSISNEQFNEFEDLLQSDTTRLMVVFVSDKDAGKLLADEYASYDQYYFVETLKEVEDTTFSKDRFSEVRGRFRNEYIPRFSKCAEVLDKSIPKVGVSLSECSGEDIEFNIDGIAPMGVDEESVSHISMSFLTKFETSIDGEPSISVEACSMSVLLIKSEVLLLNVYRTYQDDRDLHLTQQAIKDWTTKTISVNQ
jgi:hypothetical protein